MFKSVGLGEATIFQNDDLEDIRLPVLENADE